MCCLMRGSCSIHQRLLPRSVPHMHVGFLIHCHATFSPHHPTQQLPCAPGIHNCLLGPVGPIEVSTELGSPHAAATPYLAQLHATASHFPPHSTATLTPPAVLCPAGDKIRFRQDPSSSSSTKPQAHGRLPKGAASTVIPASVLNKFAGDGYVYRGKVDLALLNHRTGYQPRPTSK
jgi:hypothetical protein